MKKYFSTIPIFILVMMNISCHHQTFDSQMEEFTKTENREAELVARLDELERLIQKEHERLVALEKKPCKESTPKREEVSRPVPTKSNVETLQTAKRVEIEPTLPVNISPEKDFQIRMEGAKSLYERKIWHKAYLAFSEIERQVDPGIARGEPLYWIGRCWLQMKEYQSAKVIFTRFLDMNPGHKLEASASLYLAKTQYEMGDKNEASRNLRYIVERYPASEETMTAKKILKNGFKGTL